MATAGFETHVFEKEANAGGVVMNTIPAFRIPESAVERDISFIEDNGVKFHFSTQTTIEKLKAEGFDYIFVAIGAEKSNDSGVSGNGERDSAISFLYKSKRGERINLGKDVVVIGGGNTAMDAARMAKRSLGVDNVTVIYRRSISEMPCDREEYDMAIRDGVNFIFLANPASLVDGVLTVKEMKLGDVDSSGRPRPVETGNTFTLSCSYLISAIGEKADLNVLKALGVEEENEHIYLVGDVKSGPSTVVKCIASARKAVESAIDEVYKNILASDDDSDSCDCEEEDECCGHHGEHECCHHHDEEHECCHSHDGEHENCDHGEGHKCCHNHDEAHECCHNHDEDSCSCSHEEEEMSDEELRLAEDRFFRTIKGKKAMITKSISGTDNAFLAREAARCVECSYLCTKCVEVCPNRANVALDMRDTGLFEDPFQILHLDAYCNECGNCATFCPHDGEPYRRKFTLFSRLDDFNSSENSGFYVADDDNIKIRLDSKVIDGVLNDLGELEADVPDEVRAMIEEVFYSYSYLLGPVGE